MLAGFEKSTGKPPEELSLPWKGMPDLKTGEETVEIFRSWRPHSMLFNLPNGNSMALSHEDECPLHPSHYGLSRQVTEAMVVVEAYKVLRDRTPYPPDQVVRDLQGKFAFVLFDARANTLFIARDRDGCIPLQWRMARDGSLVCSDDPNVIAEACGNCCTFFPPGFPLFFTQYILHFALST
ncbi:hypothetical protein CsSME_00030496 [Camellia sinensis var. sinensis]